MPILKVECWTVVCDGCGYDNDHGDFIPHYATDPRESEPEDWTIRGDEALCSECCNPGEEPSDER